MFLTKQAHLEHPLPWLQVCGIRHPWAASAAWAHGLTADLHPGLTVITGGDGAGKTTCLRLLAAECPPSSGTLHLHAEPGKPMAAWPQPEAYRAEVFWCDPASDALDHLSGQQYLARHQLAHVRWNDSVVADLLQAFDLEDHLHKPLFGLSMGMRRKLRLAAALGSGAVLTLLDDPVAALDHASCRLVAELMQDCAQASHRLVVATAFDRETASHLGASQVLAL